MPWATTCLKFTPISAGFKKEGSKIIKISACIIAKNEAKNIPTWLKCVKAIAHEIIVVDTGSTDNTVEIAKEGGATVLFFKWCDDFAKAKNFAIDHVTGEWVIFLDADEYFPPQSIEALKKAIKRYHPKREVIGLMCRLLNLNADDNLKLISVIRQIRVFRNLKSLRYVGKIHEALMSTAPANRKFQEVPEIEIYHTGYSTSILKRKLERNLEMLKAKAKEEGEEKPDDSVYYLSCYYGMNDLEKAEEYAKIAINSGLRFLGMEMSIYRQYISTLVALNRPFKEILEIIEKACQKFPDSVEFVFTKAFYYAREGDYLEAKKLLKTLDSLEKKEDLNIALDDSALAYVPDIYELKARIARFEGDIKKANMLAYEGLSHAKLKDALLITWYQTADNMTDEEKIKHLGKYYDKDDATEADFVVKTLLPYRAFAICRHYAQNLPSKKLQALLKGDFVGAIAYLSQEILALKSLSFELVKDFNMPPQGGMYALMSQKERVLWEEITRQKKTDDEG